MLQTNIVATEFGAPSLVISLSKKPSIEIDLLDFYRNQDHLNNMNSHINKYMSTLDPKVQEALYRVYEEVHLFNGTNNYADIEATRYLEGKLEEAAQLLNMDNWRLWFRDNSKGLHIPDSVKDKFTEDLDMGITRDKTYVTSEYIDLIGLILFIRALSPIYICYLSYTKVTSKHPYFLTFRLFVGSCIDKPEIELGKLREYIDANYTGLIGTGSKNEHLIITAGLSDDDIIEYLMAEVIFNKLLTIDFFNVECNAVSYIFQTIRYKGNFRPTGTPLRASSSRGGSDREDYSYFEDYRKTTSIPIGTVVEIQHALSDPHKLAFDMGYKDFDFKLYNSELKNIGKLTENPPSTIQIYLLGWLLHKVINPRALFYLETRKIVELLVFAKVALLNTNQSFIAVFLTSIRGDDSQFLNIVIRNTLNRNLITNLRKHFNFVMGSERGSIIESTISEISKEMSNNVWTPVGSLGNTKNLVTKEGYIDMSSNVNDIVTSYVAYVLGDKDASVLEVKS